MNDIRFQTNNAFIVVSFKFDTYIAKELSLIAYILRGASKYVHTSFGDGGGEDDD